MLGFESADHPVDDAVARALAITAEHGGAATTPERGDAGAAASWRSTTICVAMPAWSVPGCHKVSRPRIRWKRISVSWIVWSRACPMCRLPVTLGGGTAIE